MLSELTLTCEGEGCDRALTAEERTITFETEGGERRAYECACGAVTITVHR